jgi:hypothetical protein
MLLAAQQPSNPSCQLLTDRNSAAAYACTQDVKRVLLHLGLEALPGRRPTSTLRRDTLPWRFT